eukprot:m.125983 g.125983  ORF g.125983 m.125983 type:complete len:301 (+) comp14684_c2_seq2:1483-2385(+)
MYTRRGHGPRSAREEPASIEVGDGHAQCHVTVVCSAKCMHKRSCSEVGLRIGQTTRRVGVRWHRRAVCVRVTVRVPVPMRGRDMSSRILSRRRRRCCRCCSSLHDSMSLSVGVRGLRGICCCTGCCCCCRRPSCPTSTATARTTPSVRSCAIGIWLFTRQLHARHRWSGLCPTIPTRPTGAPIRVGCIAGLRRLLLGNNLWLGIGLGFGFGIISCQTGLDHGLGVLGRDERTKLWSRESIHMARLRSNQEKHLSASQHTQFIGLFHDASFTFAEGNVSTIFVLDKFNLDFSSSPLLPLFI